MGNKYGYNGANGQGIKPKGGMGNMMQQAQQMQEQLLKAQEQLDQLEVVGSASGGLVTVKANAKKVITAISINPDIVDRDDVEMLEDMILAAIGDAYNKAQAEEDKLMAPFVALKGLI